MKLKFLERFRTWRHSLPKFSELVDPRHTRLIILSFTILTLLIIGAIVFTQINKRMLAEETARIKREAEKGASFKLEAPGFNDFVFPETIKMKSNAIYPSREPRKFWTEDEIREFWVDLDTIDLESFSEINHNLIESKLLEEP